MPWGDGTGPWGLGPRTGRALGFCAGYPVPGFMHLWGRPAAVWGRGRGLRWMYLATGLPGWARFGYPYAAPGAVAPAYPPAPVAPGEEASAGEIAYLKGQASFLKTQLEAIESRLRELEGQEKRGKDEE